MVQQIEESAGAYTPVCRCELHVLLCLLEATAIVDRGHLVSTVLQCM